MVLQTTTRTYSGATGVAASSSTMTRSPGWTSLREPRRSTSSIAPAGFTATRESGVMSTAELPAAAFSPSPRASGFQPGESLRLSSGSLLCGLLRRFLPQ
ncbi:hypothetical protein BAUCODRAFT_240048 [Baudoinia panamericana UAMH 10762]|uniref:Uncharacterized protein n=1 Tax=Baudoinia panamericana (strain UAMH 10762) TaxID=717646 RepID=M2N3Y5_BAUPA|nr:uncharacterized protein BAUCODRAFT_240048 [Baudoinia panamericana UAMH 10762]EMC93420.1 hypothetical protein BAUCODRAFT_240048 [Baudoinia panamericana UAMH 10762]